VWDYYARLVEAHDGDTYILAIDLGFDVATRQHIRLRGANCPELHQPGGPEALAYATALLEAGQFTVTTGKLLTRSFERYVATVTLTDGRSLADVLIAAGHAEAMHP
jgi:endonuclease YncB( thermonuclease family)